MQIRPLGDNVLVVEVGDEIDESTRRRVQTVWRALSAEPLPGVGELVPSYTSVAAFYEPREAVEAGAPEADVAGWLTAKLRERLKHPPKAEKVRERTIEIPVCYGGEFGPDLARVAAHTGLAPEEVVKRHAKTEYIVHLIGFAPGFPYLGGLPKELATPRHAKPRNRVPAGSVAIAGRQAGIYPLATPAGWNVIGRTPVRLFLPEDNLPVLLQAGDRVRFREITPDEFAARTTGKT